MECLFLSEPDMIKAGILDMKKCVKVIDETFYLLGKKDYIMGGASENAHGIQIWFPDEKRTDNMPVSGTDRRFMAMVSYLGGRFDVCGQKWYGSNRANLDKGLPRSILTVMLNDKDTSAPLAIMSANLLSSMRTGAVTGVAAKYLQSEGSSVIGIIGAGVISRACLLAIAETLKNKKEAKVYDIFKERSVSFCDELSKLIDIDVHPVDTLKEAVMGSDVVNIASSGANPPNIEYEWVKDGAVIMLSGSGDLNDELYLDSRIVVDNYQMHKDWRDEALQRPNGMKSARQYSTYQMFKLIMEGAKKPEDIAELGDIVIAKKEARKDNKEKIIFLAGGMSIEDIAWGYEVYKNALEKGIGQTLKYWDKPHWA